MAKYRRPEPVDRRFSSYQSESVEENEHQIRKRVQQHMGAQVKAGFERRMAETREYGLWIVERLGECGIQPDFQVQYRFVKPSEHGWKYTGKSRDMGAGWALRESPRHWVEESWEGGYHEREMPTRVPAHMQPATGWCLTENAAIALYERSEEGQRAYVHEKNSPVVDFSSGFLTSQLGNSDTGIPQEERDVIMMELGGITDATYWDMSAMEDVRLYYEQLLGLSGWNVFLDEFVEAREIAE